MSTIGTTAGDKEHGDSRAAWELEGDLSSLSCNAAVEIDELLLGRTIGLKAVGKLVKSLRSEMLDQPGQPKPSALLDSTTVDVLNRAIDASQFSGHMTTIDQLRGTTKGIVQDLEQLVRDPVKMLQDVQVQVVKLKKFCLELSRVASTFQASYEDHEPENPYRRISRPVWR